MKEMGFALILEDDRAVADLIKEVVVEETNLWPMVVSSCDDALAVMKREEKLPGLVILDYDLVGSRYECLLQMRQYRETRQRKALPVVMANKDVLVIAAEEWLHVFQKPVTYARLKAVVRHRENSAPRRRRKPGRQE